MFTWLDLAKMVIPQNLDPRPARGDYYFSPSRSATSRAKALRIPSLVKPIPFHYRLEENHPALSIGDILILSNAEALASEAYEDLRLEYAPYGALLDLQEYFKASGKTQWLDCEKNSYSSHGN